jgi:hypothetical protein
MRLDDTLDPVAVLDALASRLAEGTTYTLSELAADKWEELTSLQAAQQIGRSYMRALKDRLITHSALHSVDVTLAHMMQIASREITGHELKVEVSDTSDELVRTEGYQTRLARHRERHA